MTVSAANAGLCKHRLRMVCMRRHQLFFIRPFNAISSHCHGAANVSADTLNATPPKSLSKVADNVDEHFTILAKWLKEQNIFGHGNAGVAHNIGIAVSGGIDSMALAVFCRRLETSGYVNAGVFRAIVVDHQARGKSSEEAQRVKQMSEKLVKITWPIGVEPLKLADFEEQARILRFRAIAQVAQQQTLIRAVMFGHHLDDQYETILMRIVSGYVGNGLLAIKATAGFPHCRSMWGVSDGPNYHQLVPAKGDDRTAARFGFRIASQGLSLHRPFLTTRKSTLQAICKQAGIEPINDPTNSDVRLTMRNTIRHMAKVAILPRALQQDSILELAEHISLSNAELYLVARRIAASVVVQRMHFPNGFVTATMPAAYNWADGSASQDNLALGLVIHEFIDSVSPKVSVKHGDAMVVLQHFFDWVIRNPRSRHGLRLTHSGVLIDFRFDSCGRVQVTVCRERPTREEVRKTMVSWDSSNQIIESGLPTSASESNSGDALHLESKCQMKLFDNRCWLSMDRRATTGLAARFLTPVDLTRARVALSSKQKDHLDKLLRQKAPGAVRWTMPAIFDASNSLIALPTMSWSPEGTNGTFLCTYKHLTRRPWSNFVTMLGKFGFVEDKDNDGNERKS